MELTTEQTAAANRIKQFFEQPHGGKPFYLMGEAGVGKTTLLCNIIAQATDAYPNRKVHVCAPTGKAAFVLMNKLDMKVFVSTIHSLLFNPKQAGATLISQLREEIAQCTDERKRVQLQDKLKDAQTVSFVAKDNHNVSPNDIVIVDEASMVSEYIFTTLLKTGAHVLLTGDPSQLPPVNSKSIYADTGTFAVKLNTVHRQAAESPIIQAAYAALKGDELPFSDNPDCRVVQKGNVTPEDWKAYNQVLTGKNSTRRRSNRWFRSQYGHNGIMPVLGERLICVRNSRFFGQQWLNGQQFTVGELEYGTNEDGDVASFRDDAGNHITMIPHYFHQHYMDFNDPDFQQHKNYMWADYGYAITVHKSQGSEWDAVIIADDGFWTDKPRLRASWLYTAITRAKSKLLLVRK